MVHNIHRKLLGYELMAQNRAQADKEESPGLINLGLLLEEKKRENSGGQADKASTWKESEQLSIAEQVLHKKFIKVYFLLCSLRLKFKKNLLDYLCLC